MAVRTFSTLRPLQFLKEIGTMQPALGLNFFSAMIQGSESLATLDWMLESRWDSQMERSAVVFERAKLGGC